MTTTTLTLFCLGDGEAIPNALCNIGDLNDNGHGVEQDYKRAMEWYPKGSHGGSAAAIYSIGELYREGKGLPTDNRRALKC